MGFEAEWLAAREPYDEAALDRGAIEAIQMWGSNLPNECTPIVVDLGSGTGAALRRVERWLAPRRLRAFAVDQDTALLQESGPFSPGTTVVPLVGDVLEPLDSLGGPADGTVDLVVGHALADLLPLDRLAARVAALLRPGGLAHLALTYDGLTAFEPRGDAELHRAVLGAFHCRQDRPAYAAPSYGGSTAGRRLAPALATAGLTIVADAPSIWHVRTADGCDGRRVLSRLIRFVVEAAGEMGEVASSDLARWERARRDALAAGTLTARVGHRDVLARRPKRP